MNRLVTAGQPYNLTGLCKLFGVSRQSYYQRKEANFHELAIKSCILEHVRKIRLDFPRMGYLKLYEICSSYFGGDFTMGRDAFYHLLYDNGLMLKLKKRTTRTTDSRHSYFLYPNLIRNFKPVSPCQLWVSDITYIPVGDGFCYLSLITDAFSRKIVGWNFADSLKYCNAEQALKEAITSAETAGFNLEGLIHHSDRGVQYAYNAYTDILKKHGCMISMTENGDPLENAMAERVNGILKQEWLHYYTFKNQEEAYEVIERIIRLYNERRPHMGINMRTPNQIHNQGCKCQNNNVSLPIVKTHDYL